MSLKRTDNSDLVMVASLFAFSFVMEYVYRAGRKHGEEASQISDPSGVDSEDAPTSKEGE